MPSELTSTLEEGDTLFLLQGGKISDPLVTIKADGTIVFGANYTPDAAAKAFWEVVRRSHPHAK